MLTEGATDAEKALAAQHWMYSVDLLKKGAIIFAGRTLDTTAESFAAVVIRANSEAEARKIAESDPAVKGGVFRARVFPYQPMLMGTLP
jgi:uncharacterized protein YciI